MVQPRVYFVITQLIVIQIGIIKIIKHRQTIRRGFESVDQILAWLVEIATAQTLWERKHITIIQSSEKCSVIIRILDRENSFRAIFVRSREKIISKIRFQSIIPDDLISRINGFL